MYQQYPQYSSDKLYFKQQIDRKENDLIRWDTDIISLQYKARAFFDSVVDELKNLDVERIQRLDWDSTIDKVNHGLKKLFQKYFSQLDMQNINDRQHELIEKTLDSYEKHLKYILERHKDNIENILDWMWELPDTLDALFNEIDFLRLEPTFSIENDIYKMSSKSPYDIGPYPAAS